MPRHEAFEELSKRIEQHSPLDIDGTPFAVWLIDVREPEQPLGTHVIVIVGAQNQSEKHTGELHLGADRLEDLDYVEESAIGVMKSIINGDLPPDARELL